MFRDFEFSWKAQSHLTFVATLVVGAAILLGVYDSLGSNFLTGTDAANLTVAKTLTVAGGLVFPLEILNWPYQFLVGSLSLIPLVNVHVINFSLGLTTIVMFYRLLLLWFDKFYAAVATLLLASSSWFLGITVGGGLGAALMLYVAASLVAITGIHRGRTLGFIIGSITIPLSLYFGWHGMALGMIQLLLLVYVLKAKKLSRPGRLLVIMSSALALLILLPFGLLLAIHPQAFVDALNINWAKNIIDTGNMLIFGSHNNPFGWPQTWPLLDIASASLILLGLIVAFIRRKAGRYQLIAALLGITLLNFAVFGINAPSLAFSLIPWYVLLASGLRYLSEAWRSVFPKNQAAYLMANLTIGILTASVASYHLVRYFDLLPQLQ